MTNLSRNWSLTTGDIPSLVASNQCTNSNSQSINNIHIINESDDNSNKEKNVEFYKLTQRNVRMGFLCVCVSQRVSSVIFFRCPTGVRPTSSYELP